MLDTVETGRVTLLCPGCKKPTQAVEEQAVGYPFWPVLVHECECGYIITESERDVVTNKKENP